MPNYNHPVISGIKKFYGNVAMKDFLRANLDQLDLAPCANYSVKMVWNPRLKRRATMAEVIHFAKACNDVLMEQCEALEANLPMEPEHRSQRSRLVWDFAYFKVVSLYNSLLLSRNSPVWSMSHHWYVKMSNRNRSIRDTMVWHEYVRYMLQYINCRLYICYGFSRPKLPN